MDIQITILRKYKKWQLQLICKEKNIDDSGTKLQLAKRIATLNDKEEQKIWDSIIGNNN